MVSWAGLWLALPFVARAVGIGLFVLLALAALYPLARFRWPTRDEALEPARPRHRHSPSPGDRADRYAGDPGSDRAGAVAGAARAHAGLDQAHPGRPAVAAAADPRSLGAARAGHGDAGGGLYRRRRRAHACGSRRRSTGMACWRRPTSGSMPGSRRRSIPAGRRSFCRRANTDAASPDSGRRLPVPAGSTLLVRSSGGTIDVVIGGGVTEVAPSDRRPRAPTSGISRSPATAPRMCARRPASRSGGSPRRPTARRPFRWPRIRNARPAARCRCPTSSRTITA